MNKFLKGFIFFSVVITRSVTAGNSVPAPEPQAIFSLGDNGANIVKHCKDDAVPTGAPIGVASNNDDDKQITAKISPETLLEELNDKKKTGSKLLSSCGFLRMTKQTAPQFHGLVEGVAKRLNIPIPLVLVFKGNVFSWLAEQVGVDFRCNAFALSLTHNLALVCIGEDLITNGISVAGLEAIIAHELSHIKCYHLLKRVGVVGIIAMLCYGTLGLRGTMIGDFLLKPKALPLGPFNPLRLSLFCDFGATGMVSLTIRGLLASLGFLFYSRVNEKEADLSAASVIKDPAALSDALYRIPIIAQEKPRFITWVLSKTMYGSHPLNKERKAYLEQFKQEQLFKNAINKGEANGGIVSAAAAA